jgi:hypothetical protein
MEVRSLTERKKNFALSKTIEKIYKNEAKFIHKKLLRICSDIKFSDSIENIYFL